MVKELSTGNHYFTGGVNDRVQILHVNGVPHINISASDGFICGEAGGRGQRMRVVRFEG